MKTPYSPLGVLRGQLLAVGSAAAALAAQAITRPLLDSASLLLWAAALAVTSAIAGPLSALTATALLIAGDWALGLDAQIPPAERAIRIGLFALLGLTVAALTYRRRREDVAVAERLAVQLDREALLESSLATVPDALVVINDTGVIQSFSNAAERLFGWSADEVVGQNVKRLMPSSYADEHDGYIDRYLSTGEAHVIGSHRQVTGLRKDGSEFPMELRIGEVRTGDKRYFTGVVRDLTTLEEAQTRLSELRAQLTQVWSLNSMGEMASVLAHELNQPLSAVANYLRAARNLIARMELEDDDLIDAVARAGDQAVRAGEIVRTMRDLAARGGTLQKPESLGAIIGEIDFIVSLMARDAGVAVFYDLHKGDDTVMADRIQIQQLVVNLARNAIEAVTKYPNRQVHISTRLDPAGNLMTMVEDSGPGVDPAVSDRLFQPLASTKPEGMGLGLSISSAIVENHKGRLWVEPSRLGGAAFCFVLARAGDDGDVSGRSDGHRRR
jgi:two-component system, LuxR family, sensor kinase FixL